MGMRQLWQKMDGFHDPHLLQPSFILALWFSSSTFCLLPYVSLRPVPPVARTRARNRPPAQHDRFALLGSADVHAAQGAGLSRRATELLQRQGAPAVHGPGGRRLDRRLRGCRHRDGRRRGSRRQRPRLAARLRPRHQAARRSRRGIRARQGHRQHCLDRGAATLRLCPLRPAPGDRLRPYPPPRRSVGLRDRSLRRPARRFRARGTRGGTGHPLRHAAPGHRGTARTGDGAFRARAR